MDDNPEIHKVTEAPASLVDRIDTAEIKKSSNTQIPTEEKYDEISQTDETGKAPLRTGRTIADFLSIYLNDTRVMATFLMFVPFPFYASHVSKLNDLLYPIIYGIILDLVWFTLGHFSKKRHKSS